MDKLISTILDPRFIAAGLIGYFVRDAIARSGGCPRCGERCACAQQTVPGMAGQVFVRQAGVARDHLVSSLQSVADERTKRFVNGFVPRVREKTAPRVVQLQLPDGEL